MKLIKLLLFIIITSCSLTENSNNKFGLDQTYQGNGVEKFFLAPQPSWANFSISGACKRSSQIRYMNYKELKTSYAFEYESIVNFQHMVNKKIDDKIRNKPSEELQLKDEAFIFYNVYEQVLGGGRDFVTPDFPKISVLWIDPFINQPKKIKQILNQSRFTKGFPVLLSDCLNSYEFETFIFNNQLNEFGVKFIGADMLSPYSHEAQMDYGFSINLKRYFKNKEITLYGTSFPSSVRGLTKEQFIQID